MIQARYQLDLLISRVKNFFKGSALGQLLDKVTLCISLFFRKAVSCDRIDTISIELPGRQTTELPLRADKRRRANNGIKSQSLSYL